MPCARLKAQCIILALAALASVLNLMIQVPISDAAPLTGRKLLFGGISVEMGACQLGAGLLVDGGTLAACVAAVAKKGSSVSGDEMCKSLIVTAVEHGVTGPAVDNLCDCVLDESPCMLEKSQSLECSTCAELVGGTIAAVEGAAGWAGDAAVAAPCAAAVVQLGIDPIFDLLCTAAVDVMITVTDGVASGELDQNGYTPEQLCNEIKSDTCPSSTTRLTTTVMNHQDDDDDDDYFDHFDGCTRDSTGRMSGRACPCYYNCPCGGNFYTGLGGVCFAPSALFGSLEERVAHCCTGACPAINPAHKNQIGGHSGQIEYC